MAGAMFSLRSRNTTHSPWVTTWNEKGQTNTPENELKSNELTSECITHSNRTKKPTPSNHTKRNLYVYCNHNKTNSRRGTANALQIKLDLIEMLSYPWAAQRGDYNSKYWERTKFYIINQFCFDWIHARQIWHW